MEATDGTRVTGTIVNGQATIGLEDFPIGSVVTVSLPTYYRSETITVPAQGTVPVTFAFTQPTLPTAIP